MRFFTYDALPGRVVFGAGASRERLAGEVDRLGVGRVLLLATERALAEELAGPLGDRVVGIFTGVRMHVPLEVAGAAREMAYASGADCLLSIGGGSTTGTAKAVALETALPIVAAPTALRDIGMKEEDLDEAVSLVLEKALEDNPRPVDEAGVRTILESAFFGKRPELVGKSF